jgi:hypothetical protein
MATQKIIAPPEKGERACFLMPSPAFESNDKA